MVGGLPSQRRSGLFDPNFQPARATGSCHPSPTADLSAESHCHFTHFDAVLRMRPWLSRRLRRLARTPTLEQLFQRIAGSLCDGWCLSGLTSPIAPDRVIRPATLRIRHSDQAGAGRGGAAKIECDQSLVWRQAQTWLDLRERSLGGWCGGGSIPCFGGDCLLAREPLSPHCTSGYGPILLPSRSTGSPPISSVAAPGLDQTETAAWVERCPRRRLRLSLGAEEDSR